jgi:hypothetical protein
VLRLGSTMVKHSTPNPKVHGLTPATETGREEMVGKVNRPFFIPKQPWITLPSKSGCQHNY